MRKALLIIAFVGSVAAASGVGYAGQSPNHGPVPVSQTDTFSDAVQCAKVNPQGLLECDTWPVGTGTDAARFAIEDATIMVRSWLLDIHPVGDVTGPDGVVHTGCDAYPVDDDGDSVLLCDDGFTEAS